MFQKLKTHFFLLSIVPIVVSCTGGIEDDSEAIRREMKTLNDTVAELTIFIGQLAEVGMTFAQFAESMLANYEPSNAATGEDVDMEGAFEGEGPDQEIVFELPPDANSTNTTTANQNNRSGGNWPCLSQCF